MSRFLPILLLAAGFLLVFSALASASPPDAAHDAERIVCEAVAAEASAEPSAPGARCWKKMGLGKVLPSCPAERAILTGADASEPALVPEPLCATVPVSVPFVATGFDPPPPKA